MSKFSATTIAAGIVGIGLGLLANRTVKKARPGSNAPFVPAAKLGSSPTRPTLASVPAASVSSAPPLGAHLSAPEPAASASAPASEPRAEGQVAPLVVHAADDEGRASMRCAQGDAAQCFAAAKSYSTKVPADRRRAHLHHRLGVQRYAERCRDRLPEACLDLARLYAHGYAVEQNTVTSRALVKRSKELCATIKSSFCEGLLAVD